MDPAGSSRPSGRGPRNKFPGYLFRRHQSLEQIKDRSNMALPPSLPKDTEEVEKRPQLRTNCDEKRMFFSVKCHSADESGAASAEGGKCASIVFEESTKSDDVVVKGGTLDKLIEYALQCSESFGDSPSACHTSFLNVFFLMHEWFSDSVTVAGMIMSLGKEDDKVMLRRVLTLIRYWINNFHITFEANKVLSSTIEAYFEQVKSMDVDDELMVSGVVEIKHEWLRLDSLKHQRNLVSDNVSSLVFNQLEPEELAKQLTVIEFKVFRRIRFSDFKSYAVGGSMKYSQHLEKSVTLFNGLSQWVQCMILSKTTPLERAKTISKFVDVAKQLHLIHNYNSLMSVIGGISHSSIARLSKTNSCLSPKYQKLLNDFVEFLSSSNNFTGYRKEYQEQLGFKIPILAVHLKDMIQINTAYPDTLLDGGLINFRKMYQLAQTIGVISSAQQKPLEIEENPNLCNTLRLSLDCHYTEDEIYEISLAREPRSLEPQSTLVKPVVFAQWVAGSKPPNPETLKRHIIDMVEAVFKVYDNDKDDMISEKEFEQIAENFPFIDSFAVLDADKDNMISKEELKNYFMKANSHALKSSFKHDFHEISYFKPTFCDRCAGLLWGLIKQGWKCKDCGINVHKHCRDTVVMECRPRSHIHGRSSTSGAEGTDSPLPETGRRHSMRGKRSKFKSVSSMDITVQSSSSEETATLMDQLSQLKREKETLQEEKDYLLLKVEQQNRDNSALRQHMAAMRQQTISFILTQMEVLEIQKNSEV